MWTKGNPRALLVGTQTGPVTVENSMESPQKIKMDLPYDLAIPLLGMLLPKKHKTIMQKNLCTPMFTTALFTTAKLWKEPSAPQYTSG